MRVVLAELTYDEERTLAIFQAVADVAGVVVAARHGHRDQSTTHRWYTHAMPRADARAGAVIRTLLEPREPPEAAATNAASPWPPLTVTHRWST